MKNSKITEDVKAETDEKQRNPTRCKICGGPYLSYSERMRPNEVIEGSGTLDRVVIQGDAFAVTQVHGGFATPTSVARIGTTAWVSEGQLAFFFDASKKNLTPSLPFRIYPVLLRKEDTK